MAWWSWLGGQRFRSRSRGSDLLSTASLSELLGSSVATSDATPPPGADTVARFDVPHQRVPDASTRPLSMRRVREALDRLDIRYLTDADGSLLAMWERHAVLFAIEGPEDEILVMRGRPHGTVAPDWADRAYRVVNEWNHTRRFCKAYVGDVTERGMLPIYAEIQVPLQSGVHDALLDELVDCAAAVTSAFVDWLHDDGALL
ncbi:MAG TPA: YbjN domain-containing protein [Micromonosporaceae bacterium]|jgi:hypothetical protein